VQGPIPVVARFPVGLCLNDALEGGVQVTYLCSPLNPESNPSILTVPVDERTYAVIERAWGAHKSLDETVLLALDFEPWALAVSGQATSLSGENSPRRPLDVCMQCNAWFRQGASHALRYLARLTPDSNVLS
jgi:hypothetical protein